MVKNEAMEDQKIRAIVEAGLIEETGTIMVHHSVSCVVVLVILLFVVTFSLKCGIKVQMVTILNHTMEEIRIIIRLLLQMLMALTLRNNLIQHTLFNMI